MKEMGFNNPQEYFEFYNSVKDRARINCSTEAFNELITVI